MGDNKNMAFIINELSNNYLDEIKPNSFYRKALLEAYRNKCFYCRGEIFRWDNYQVDHFLPKSYFQMEQKVEDIRNLYGFPDNLDLNLFQESFFNLVPMHSGCNLHKSNNLFSPVTYLMQLETIYQKIQLILEEQKKLLDNSNELKIIAELDGYLESGLISMIDLVYYFDINSNHYYDNQIKYSIEKDNKRKFKEKMKSFLHSEYKNQCNDIRESLSSFIMENSVILEEDAKIIAKLVTETDNGIEYIPFGEINFTEKELDEIKTTLNNIMMKTCHQKTFGEGGVSLSFGYMNLAKKETNNEKKIELILKAESILKDQLDHEINRKSEKITLIAIAISIFESMIMRVVITDNRADIKNILLESKQLFNKIKNSNSWKYIEIIDILFRFFFILFILNERLSDINSKTLFQNIEHNLFKYCKEAPIIFTIIYLFFESKIGEFIEFSFSSNFKEYMKLKAKEIWNNEIGKHNDLKEKIKDFKVITEFKKDL